MPIPHTDPHKAKRILVVHGISTGTDADLYQNKRLESTMRQRLTMPVDFMVDMFLYESMNDSSQQILQAINTVFTRSLIAETVIDYTIDMVGDVVQYLIKSTTGREITDKLKQRIMHNFEFDHNPLTIVAHSLGSLYAFDAVMELIVENPSLFNPDGRGTWPVQSLVTIGSPVGLPFFNDRQLQSIPVGRSQIRWFNYYDALDPIVSGNIFGNPTEKLHIAGKFATTGWDIRDVVLNNGSSWLSAHTGYWENQSLADDLISIITT